MATTLPDSNIERVRWAFYDVLNTRDVSQLRRIWSAGIEQRFPDRTCNGPDEVAAYFHAVFDALPDFHMEAIAITGDEDTVFVHWHMTGHHTGIPFQGVAATGSAIDLEGMDHFEFDADGMIKRNTVLYDQMAFARQIGFIPPDGSAADKAAKAAFNAKTRLVEKVRARRG